MGTSSNVETKDSNDIKEPIQLVDEDRVQLAIKWFVKFITVEQKNAEIDFYSGYMENHEGYKRELFRNGHDALELDKWSETWVGTGKILKQVCDGLEAKDDHGKNNIVDYHSINNLRDKAITDINSAERILFELLKGSNVGQSFDDACKFFGRWYPVFSYLMFLRDATRYLPVKSSDENHGDRLRKLKISRECLNICSWSNYQIFLSIHRKIQEILSDSFPDKKITFLDAHSFVWTLWKAPENLIFEEDEKFFKIPGSNNLIDDISEQHTYKEKAFDENRELEEQLDKAGVVGKEREVFARARVNQGVFRKRLLRRYQKCCLCGVTNKNLLKASHIKPWCNSNPDEKISVDNGLLMCPNHDALFDSGWISFDDNGKIMISDALGETDRAFLNVRDIMTIDVREGNLPYLKYHRENIFYKKNNKTEL